MWVYVGVRSVWFSVVKPYDDVCVRMWVYAWCSSAAAWFTMNQRLVQQQVQWFRRCTWFSVAVTKSYDIHIDFIHEIIKSRFKEFVWFVTHCLVQNESTLVTRP